MKFGIRKPSIKKSLKARTTGKLKRKVKKALIPGYGKKGVGWIKNPKKALYNKTYHKTTVSLFHFPNPIKKTKKSAYKKQIKKKPLKYNFCFGNNGGENSTMKVCKLCGTVNSDSDIECTSCGRKDFKNWCENCCISFEGDCCPDCGRTIDDQEPVKERKTWLWVLGWIFIFPIPLTILMLRNQKLSKNLRIGIIAVAWILYLVLIFGVSSNDSERNGNIQKMSFADTSDVTVKVGETVEQGYLKVDVKSSSDFTYDDILFVSDNPDVATIKFTNDTLRTYLYFEIEGIGAGETKVYATSKDGKVSSEKINVFVSQPIEVNSIDLSCSKNTICLGESICVQANILPSNADNITLSWSSSDESVATVDNNGRVSAIGGGTAIITAKTKNNISSSVTINVDDSKRTMNLRVIYSRIDDNNIGDEWDYITQINGNRTTDTITISNGEKLNLFAKFSEEDKKPDIGKASTTHKVTKNDLINGFDVSMDLYVTENNGRYSGKKAHFVVTYSFKP